MLGKGNFLYVVAVLSIVLASLGAGFVDGH